MDRPLIVTHHAPDLDAIGAVWLLKRFDAQHFADARVGFVNPGDTITLEEAEEHGCQLHEVTHVDTGLGEFDHHQPERGHQIISASSLVYDHVVKIHPDLSADAALKELVNFITQTDHFQEINWPEAGNLRYSLIIHELIHGIEFTDPHDDESQLQFGMKCLDIAYANFTQQLRAQEIIAHESLEFTLPFGKALGINTSNDDTIKLAQKMGYLLVVRKDPKEGNVRIKARPDAPLDLRAVADALAKADPKATWYYHPSGKMLLNGSKKHRNQKASALSLVEVIEIIKKSYPATN